jgi:hypothetical protein
VRRSGVFRSTCFWLICVSLLSPVVGAEVPAQVGDDVAGESPVAVPAPRVVTATPPAFIAPTRANLLPFAQVPYDDTSTLDQADDKPAGALKNLIGLVQRGETVYLLEIGKFREMAAVNFVSSYAPRTAQETGLVRLAKAKLGDRATRDALVDQLAKGTFSEQDKVLNILAYVGDPWALSLLGQCLKFREQRTMVIQRPSTAPASPDEDVDADEPLVRDFKPLAYKAAWTLSQVVKNPPVVSETQDLTDAQLDRWQAWYDEKRKP